MTLNAFLPKHISSPTDPSNFHTAFQIIISRNGGTPFNINTHHDFPGIFQNLIVELKRNSPDADGIISTSIVSIIVCDK